MESLLFLSDPTLVTADVLLPLRPFSVVSYLVVAVRGLASEFAFLVILKIRVSVSCLRFQNYELLSVVLDNIAIRTIRAIVRIFKPRERTGLVCWLNLVFSSFLDQTLIDGSDRCSLSGTIFLVVDFSVLATVGENWRMFDIEEW